MVDGDEFQGRGNELLKQLKSDNLHIQEIHSLKPKGHRGDALKILSFIIVLPQPQPQPLPLY